MKDFCNDPNCCGHNHGHEHTHEHIHTHTHDKDSCPVCSQAEPVTPEQYLNRIEEAVNKIPRKKTRERMDRIILLTAGTAAAAAEHKDFTMLEIAEVYLTLRLAEESGHPIPPEDGSPLFRDIARMVGLGLTAKYGLEGLSKFNLGGDSTVAPAALTFITCFGLGKVLSAYFRLQAKGSALTPEQAKETFKRAKAEAERLAK